MLLGWIKQGHEIPPLCSTTRYEQWKVPPAVPRVWLEICRKPGVTRIIVKNHSKGVSSIKFELSFSTRCLLCLQHGIECWCDDKFGKYGFSFDCNSVCRADENALYPTLCGSAWRNSIYAVDPGEFKTKIFVFVTSDKYFHLKDWSGQHNYLWLNNSDLITHNWANDFSLCRNVIWYGWRSYLRSR